jgi:NAD(P)H-hydrate epimerase
MRIVDTAEMRAAEAAAFARGVSGFQLMRQAGRAAAELITSQVRRFGFSRIVFLCGGGNNAGDALVAASMLAYDFPCILYLSRPLSELHGAAAEAAATLPEKLTAEAVSDFDALELRSGDLVIDGLLGIGLQGEVRRPLADVIRRVNELRLPVIALDVPSGMDSDSGRGCVPDGTALRASCTITFGMPKRGLFTLEGIAFSGPVHIADIGLSEAAGMKSVAAYSELEAVRDLPRFDVDTHKTRRGKLLVMAGSRRYPGAAALAAVTGLRGGAGLVRLLHPEGAGSRLPHSVIPVALRATGQGGFATAPDWNEYPGAAALVAGPGWGDDVPLEVLQKVLDFPGALLLDADALNLLARHPDSWRGRKDVIMTPHPGEAERLRRAFGIPVALDRVQLAEMLAERTGAVIVLKGPRTVVAAKNLGLSLNISGSADLATAGSGDVLSGLIGALLTNGMSAYSAARLGVFIHGRAGELCGRGCIADDLPMAICTVMEKLENKLFF